MQTTQKLLGTILLALVMIGCSGKTIVGSGNSISETRDIRNVRKIRLEGAGNLIVTIGNTESFTVEGDDNLIEQVTTKTRNGQLIIGFKRIRVKVQPTAGLTYRITVPSLEALTLTGAGNVELNGLADTIRIDLNGSGNITANGTVPSLRVDLNGAGIFNGADLHSDQANISLNGSSMARVHTTETLNATINGTGAIRYSGNPAISRDVNGLGIITQVEG